METVVRFPDPELVAQIAKVEAAQERPPITFNWIVGVGYALICAAGGAALYAGVTYATKSQLGIVSVVIGIATGMGAARGGRSREAQVVGAAAAAIGYFAGLLGAVAAIVGFDQFSANIVEVITLVGKRTFSSIDVVFLAIAVYEGWKIPRPR